MNTLRECEASLQTIKEELLSRQLEYDKLVEEIYRDKRRIPSPTQLSELAQKGSSLSDIHHTALVQIQKVYEEYKRVVSSVGAKGLKFEDSNLLFDISSLNEETESAVFIEKIDHLSEEINRLSIEFEAFEKLIEKISVQQKALREIYQSLVDLNLAQANDKEQYQQFLNQSKDPSCGHPLLLERMIEQKGIWEQYIQNFYTNQVEEAFKRLEKCLERLMTLGLDGAEEATKFKEVEALKKVKQDKEVLEYINNLIEEFTQKAENALAKLLKEIEELRAQAFEQTKRLHHSMPEVIRLSELLNAYDPNEESALLEYKNQLQEALENSNEAGSKALLEFSQIIKDNENYVFPTVDDAERIGTALHEVADQYDQYSGLLWQLCSEALLRVELADLEEMDQTVFYDKFGYKIIRKSFQAALNNKDFLPVLSLFNSQFAPPNTSFINGGTIAVLKNNLVSPVFQAISDQNLLKLDLFEVRQLRSDLHKVLLLILKNSRDLSLHIRIRLQWSAILHEVFQLNSPEHRAVSQMLLDALCDSRQYISLFYALQALGLHYPELWTCPEYRPMIDHVIRQVVQKGDSGNGFLVELCHNPGVETLIRGDAVSEFLVACLSLYLFYEKDEEDVREVAWVAWDRLKLSYPTLADLVLRMMRGEDIGSNLEDEMGTLKRQYDERIMELSNRIQIPYSDHHTLYQVFIWYLETYFRPWIDVLRKDEISQRELQAMKDAIRRLRKEDLLSHADENLRNKHKYLGSAVLPGTLKNKAKSRLFELIDSFDRLVKMALQRKSAKPLDIDRKALKEEMEKVINISPQDTGRWAVLHLLKPVMPFISSLVD